MNNEIIIVCNSHQFVQEISSGRWNDLDTRNLFTCNNAYTHFRTSARHFNMFSDAIDIKRHVEMPEKLHNGYHSKVEFVYYDFLGLTSEDFPGLNYSPVVAPASSAIQALWYLGLKEKFDTIYLIGYTMNEWDVMAEEGMRFFTWQEEWKRFFNKYTVTTMKENVYKFTLK